MGIKCEQCDHVATVHLIEIKNGQKTEKHLCERHAVECGATPKINAGPLNELLANFEFKHVASGGEAVELACDGCGTTYDEFRRSGLLGCPECYSVFEAALTPLLERAHEGGKRHVGKVPARGAVDELRQQRLHRLRQELEEALAGEKYERAAELRDKITKEEDKP